MSVIIRLQNLPWAANAADIRAYFNGLSIPEGGVHIVGGEQGDAFIAFSTDEDARQAMLLDGGKLKEVKIKLFLSSRTEMLRVIEQARQQTLSVQSMINNVPPPAPIAPAAPSVVAAVVPSSPFDGKQDVQEEQKSPDDKVDRKDRYRSTSRERGRDRSRERARSRDRSRGSYRDRRGDRRRSRDRYRRRSRSRDRRRNSKDRDNKDSRNKKKEINKDQEIIDLSPKEDEVPNVLAPPPAAKVPILPDPPAVPPVLLQMPVTTTSASKDPTPAVPVMNFPTPNSDGPPFPYNPQMGAIPPQAFMQMRGAEGWNPAQMVAPMAMGMPRPMMPGMEMGIPPFPAPYGMPGMFPGADPTMWRPPMMPSAALVPEQPKNDNEGGACIEIRGLPLTVSYGELKKWFEGLSISSDGIKMINDSHGNRTGITYIRFGNPGHKKAALNLDGTRYKGNVVEVLHLKDSIFQSAIDNFKPTPEEPRKFNPLDYKWTKNDRDRDTRDRDWERNERERRPEKERDHEREREKERDRERGERDRVRNLPRNGDPRMNAEPRGPETRPPSDPRPNTRFSSDPRATSEPRANNDARPSPRPQPTLITEPPKKTDCIVIQGLPLDCHEKDVAVFFEDLDIEPVNIFFVLNQMGQPIGDAFCQFASFEEAEKASSKNNERMGNRPVSVLLIPKEEMDRVMNSQAPPIKPSRWGGPPRPVLPPMHKMGMGIGIGRGGYPPMGPPFRGRFHSGELGERFPSEEREGFPFERHMGDDRRFRGRMEDDGRPLRGRVERSWRPPMMRGMRGGRGRGGGFNSDPYLTRDGPPPLPHRERHREPSPFIDTPDGFGRPGCVVAMENVHFNADINEIIDFFEGFEVDHENVIRRFDESGRPTGDARVSLNSPSEAERAVEQLNFKMLRGRTVKVSLL